MICQRSLWSRFHFAVCTHLICCAYMILAGCSSKQPPTVPKTQSVEVTSPEQTANPGDTASTPNFLAPNVWTAVDWASKDLDQSVPESEAELVAVEQGLQITIYDRRGPVHVTLGRELLDEFEVTATVVQPSVTELREDGMPEPSPFAGLVGIRSEQGSPSYRTHLKRDSRLRETYDITVRASRQQISFTINGQKPLIQSRLQLQPVHFFLELPKNSRSYLVSFSLRENLPPDPALVALAERLSKPQASSGPAMQPMMFGPSGPLFGPGVPNMGMPFDASGPPPSPSRQESLLFQQPWSIPKSGNESVDAAIVRDVRFEPDEHGVTVSKTMASEGFWVIWNVHSEGNFIATTRVSIPSMSELAAVAGPSTLLAVGMYPASDDRGVVVAAPPPMPNGPREFELKVRRSNGRVTLDVAGLTMQGGLTTDDDVRVGLYARGGMRFSIHDSKILGSTRVWTDAGGTRKIEATFIQLDGDVLHIRRNDGKQFSMPLSAFSAEDQEIARQLQKLAADKRK